MASKRRMGNSDRWRAIGCQRYTIISPVEMGTFKVVSATYFPRCGNVTFTDESLFVLQTDDMSVSAWI